jgi:hypothetical protein
MKAVRRLDPLVQDGCGLTVTEVKQFMSNLSETKNIEISNGDIKKFLIENMVIEYSFVQVLGSMSPRCSSLQL